MNRGLPARAHGVCRIAVAMLRFALVLSQSVSALGCSGGGVAKPALAPQPDAAFSEVPYPPPPPRAEDVPDSPRKGAVWIDGQWMWKAKRWVWDSGGWVLPPTSGRFARWQTRRLPDGSLSYALGVWRDPGGNPLPYPDVLAPPRDEPRLNHAPSNACRSPETAAAENPIRDCP
jgi:hypothetical protein